LYRPAANDFQRIYGLESSYYLKMKLRGTWLLAALLGWVAGPACAQLQPLPGQPLQGVFGGGGQIINVRWHNAGNQPVADNILANLLQATSATTAPYAVFSLKKLQVLPQQTVL